MPQKVLIIDDSKPVHTLVRARLCDEPIELHSAYNAESGLAMAAALMPDLVLLDVDMPQPDGFEVCRRLKADPATMGIPVIFLTGASSTDEKIRGLELGAVDYITKPFEPAELRARVKASLRTKYLLDLLSKKAMVDGLTGLWNRAYFEQRLDAELSLALRSGHALTVILLDVDHFKGINDRFGHRFGDEVLRTVSAMLMEASRAEDIVCRYGGEEFAIIAPNTPLDGAVRLADRLCTAVASRVTMYRSQIVKVTCSFGIADSGGTSDLPMVERADRALYRAKEAGRNCVMVDGQEPASQQQFRQAV